LTDLGEAAKVAKENKRIRILLRFGYPGLINDLLLGLAMA
jgi:hypothetical protein